MMIIGITGPTGAGKTTALEVLPGGKGGGDCPVHRDLPQDGLQSLQGQSAGAQEPGALSGEVQDGPPCGPLTAPPSPPSTPSAPRTRDWALRWPTV